VKTFLNIRKRLINDVLHETKRAGSQRGFQPACPLGYKTRQRSGPYAGHSAPHFIHDATKLGQLWPPKHYKTTHTSHTSRRLAVSFTELHAAARSARRKFL